VNLIEQKLDELSKHSDAIIDEIFRKNTLIAEERINCLDCANCCKTISPIIESHEIPIIARELNISPEELFEKYIEMDEDGDFVFKTRPCPMLNLKDNRCKIYENRPRSCRQYPHTNMVGIMNYRDILEENYNLCPIVQDVVDNINLKDIQ
jgi:Fe-S-cluster containining protein